MGPPVELGLTPAHLAVAVAGIVVAMLLALAIGNGALARLAPGPSAPGPASAASAGASPSATQVTVRPGDTLWDIARRAQPTGDVRPLVDRLVAAYGASPLQPGQAVAIPR